jgi:hypothetical protein
MSLPSHATEPPPDAALLEFIAQWGESAALIDQAEDTSPADQPPALPAPEPVEEADATR